MPNHWPAFCKTTGLEALIDDPKYSSFDARVAHRAELIVEIEKATTQKSSDYWIEALNEARVPCGPIYAMDGYSPIRRSFIVASPVRLVIGTRRDRGSGSTASFDAHT